MNAAEQLYLNQFSSSQLASAADLERIRTMPTMDAMDEVTTYQPVRLLARMLGALVRMGYDGIDASQTLIGANFANLFPAHNAPSRATVGRWLRKLADAGMLIIPRSNCYSDRQTKSIVFSDNLKAHVLEHEELSMCSNVRHAHQVSSSIERSNLSTVPHSSNRNLSRASEVINPPEHALLDYEARKPRNTHRRDDLSRLQRKVLWAIKKAGRKLPPAEVAVLWDAYLQNPHDEACRELERYLDGEWTESEKIGGARMFLPRLRRLADEQLAAIEAVGATEGSLTKPLRSILHWIGGSWSLRSQSEGVKLCVKLVLGIGDGRISRFVSRWSDWTPRRRQRATGLAVKYLRSLDVDTTVDVREAEVEKCQVDEARANLVAAMCNPEISDYCGPGRLLFYSYRKSETEEERTAFVEGVIRGTVPLDGG